jgi:hypothetical protein
MRTLPQALAHIKTNDPDTALTLHALKVMVISGKVPHGKVGVKKLVDISVLEKFLSGECSPANSPPPQSQHGQIRRLS